MPYQYARLTVKFYKNVIRGNLTSRLCHSVELRMAVIAGGASAASLETCRGVPVVGQSGHAASGSEMKTRRRVVMRHLRGQGVRAPRFVCRTQAGAGIDKIGRVSSGGRGSNVSREQRRGGGAVRRRRSLADGGGKDSAASRRCRRSERGDMPETCCVLPWGIRAVFAAACVAARAAAKMCAPHALSLWSRSRADFESCP